MTPSSAIATDESMSFTVIGKLRLNEKNNDI